MARRTRASRATRRASQEEHKRLGQFFTGPQLARLLAALAEAWTATRVIDPMAGSGDMLAAANESGANKVLAGVEIDPLSAIECLNRMSASNADMRMAVGDAFSPITWSQFTPEPWELVITNPPYVRYQRGAHGASGRVKAPGAQQVRTGLIELIARRTDLPHSDRIVFEDLARSYSGLADLAVPAWILCASLVAVGGRLAMVLPGTWLTRDYALPILYLLTRYFDIEAVIEDAEATWFDDALVRTTLLVARRVMDRRVTGVLAPDHLHVRLWPAAADEKSLVGAAMSGRPDPERAFAALVRGQFGVADTINLLGTEAERVGGAYYRNLVTQQGSGSRWFEAVEGGLRSTRESVPLVPRHAMRVLGTARPEFRSLEAYGWRVGQGLRTGANRFFYGSCIEERTNESLIAVDSAVYSEPITVPRDAVRFVIRRQREALAGAMTESRLLYLSRYALPEDVEATHLALGFCPYAEMPRSLATYIRIAATCNLGTKESPRFIPQLSAVATNARPARLDHPKRPSRFWYQLAPLVDRHVPDLFLPRIIHESPVPFVNQAGHVIDANFSTFWRSQEEALPVPALAAILRSTWVRLVLESSATVLGGGALKVEALHLRRMPLPSFEEGVIAALTELGEGLMSEPDKHGDLTQIDSLVWRAIGTSPDVGVWEILLPLIDRRRIRPNWSEKATEAMGAGS